MPCGMIRRWRLKLIYQMFVKLLSWMVLSVRSDTANKIEILVLRHSGSAAADAHLSRGSIGATAP